ncbi:MAG: PQQ-binding-like beta-propeller repeat protein [Alphaproteobacteria bacterium]
MPTTVSLEKDPEAESIEVTIEDPVANMDWPQPDYNAAHKMPHVEAGDLKNLVWKTSIGQGNTSTGFLLSTPLIENDTIFTLDTEGYVKAKSLQTGKDIWRHRLEMKNRKENCSGGGISLGDGKVFAAFSSADVVALNNSTGEVIWQTTLAHSIRSAPTYYKGFLYLITKNNRLICLSAASGEKIWQQEGSEHSCALVGGGAPALQYDTLIAPYSSGEIYALKRENGFPLWAESLSALRVFSSASMVSHIKASPVIDQDMIIALSQSGRMVGMEYRSGNIIWEREIRGTSTPVVHGSFIFMVTTDHQALCLVRDSGKIVWVTKLPGYGTNINTSSKLSYAGPVLAGHKLLICGSEGKAFFLKPATGEMINQINLPGPCYLPPIVANKVAYFLTESGTLAAFE